MRSASRYNFDPNLTGLDVAFFQCSGLWLCEGCGVSCCQFWTRSLTHLAGDGAPGWVWWVAALRMGQLSTGLGTAPFGTVLLDAAVWD